eukprot:m51a1_g11405 hypothetical protein (511) ;mRNA; r:4989-6887
MLKATGPVDRGTRDAEATGVRYQWRLFCLCSSLAGVQFPLSILCSVCTPLFHDELRMDPSLIALVFAGAGPVCALLQPAVGAWSDSLRCRWGRRRPFVAVGAVMCALGMALVAASVELGKLLGDNPKGEHATEHRAAIAISVTGLWIMLIFMNVVGGPARAIVADLVPVDRQQEGNAMASGVMALAAIVASVVGAQLFFTAAPYRNLYAVGVVFVLISSVPTLVVAKEELPISPEPSADGTAKRSSGLGAVARFFHGFVAMPRKMVMVVMAYSVGLSCYGPFLAYLTDYFGVEIYGGGPSEDLRSKYQDGVRMGMYAMAASAAAQWLFAFVLPLLVCKAGPAISMAVAQALSAAAMIGFFPLGRSALAQAPMVATAIVLTCSVSVCLTVTATVPFGLVRTLCGPKDAGLYMGILSAAGTLSMTLSNIAAGVIITKAPHDAPNNSENSVYGFLFGAVLSVAAIILALFLPCSIDCAPPERQPLLINEDSGESQPAQAAASSYSSYGSATYV